MSRNSIIKKKVCLLGPFAVGKTSLIERFVHNRFDDKYLTTIGVKVSKKRLPPIRGLKHEPPVQLDLLIWDIAGMEKFDSVVENYYRGAAGALAVADLTRKESFGHLREICKRFHSVNPSSQVIVLGNKLDICEHPEKNAKRLKEMDTCFSSKGILTSAKTGEGVEAGFHALAQKMVANSE